MDASPVGRIWCGQIYVGVNASPLGCGNYTDLCWRTSDLHWVPKRSVSAFMVVGPILVNGQHETNLGHTSTIRGATASGAIKPYISSHYVTFKLN